MKKFFTIKDENTSARLPTPDSLLPIFKSVPHEKISPPRMKIPLPDSRLPIPYSLFSSQRDYGCSSLTKSSRNYAMPKILAPGNGSSSTTGGTKKIAPARTLKNLSIPGSWLLGSPPKFIRPNQLCCVSILNNRSGVS